MIKMKCEICGTERHSLARFCKRCKKILSRSDTRRKASIPARIHALSTAWDGSIFRCYYTGIPLVEDNHRDPRYLTFDHLIPRDEQKIVVAAACINDMKSDLTEQEFRAVTKALASKFEGGHFDENLLKLTHWKR